MPGNMMHRRSSPDIFVAVNSANLPFVKAYSVSGCFYQLGQDSVFTHYKISTGFISCIILSIL